MKTIASIEEDWRRENVSISGRLYSRKKSRFDRLHARKVSTLFPQTLMGGLCHKLCPWFKCRVQVSRKTVCFCRPPLLYQRDQINSLRNCRDYDLKQIENAFRDPEDGFREKNSSEGIVGNSEVY